MTDLATRPSQSTDLIEQVVIQGNLANLNAEQRAAYYSKVCESLGLNPYTRPFEYLTLSGKLILYARKDATDQLRNLHCVSVEITSQQAIGDIYVVAARARTPDGRTDEEIGAVTIKGLTGDALCNAYMKSVTKAKRRVTLSICGLGLLDESELETIPPGQQRVHVDETPPRVSPSVTSTTDPHRAPELMRGAVTGAVPIQREPEIEPPPWEEYARDEERQPALIDAPRPASYAGEATPTPTVIPDALATAPQVNAIYAIASKERRMNRVAVDEATTERYGVAPSAMTKRQASAFITELKGD